MRWNGSIWPSYFPLRLIFADVPYRGAHLQNLISSVSWLWEPLIKSSSSGAAEIILQISFVFWALSSWREGTCTDPAHMKASNYLYALFYFSLKTCFLCLMLSRVHSTTCDAIQPRPRCYQDQRVSRLRPDQDFKYQRQVTTEKNKQTETVSFLNSSFPLN